MLPFPIMFGAGTRLPPIPQLFYAAPPASVLGSGSLFDFQADAANNRVFALDLTNNAILEFGVSTPSSWGTPNTYQSATNCKVPYSCDMNPGATRLAVCTSGGTSRGVSFFDISVPGTITFLGRVDSATLADTRDVSYIDATHWAVTDGTSGMAIIDTTVEAVPVILVAASTYTGAIGTCRGCDYYAAGKLLAVASRSNASVVIFDLSTIASPVVAGSIANATAFTSISEANWFATGTRMLTLSTGIRNKPSLGGDCIGVVNASAPASPTLVSFIQSHVVLSGARRSVFSASEKTLFVANNSRDSFAAVSLANEQNLQAVAEALGSPHAAESASPTASQYGAAHGVCRIGTSIFGGGDFTAYGWRASFNVAAYP